MRVSIFKCVKAPKPQETDLKKIVSMMQSSPLINKRTLIYRHHLVWQQKKKVKDFKVSKFPAFCPCAILYDGKCRNDVMGLTDLCYFDIDHIKGEEEINKAISILREDRSVLLASRSVSGDGIHILVRYQVKNMEMAPQRITMSPKKMQKLYSRVFDILGRQYQQMLNQKIDRNAGNMERLFIVSYDLELYYNPDAEPIIVDLKDPKNSVKELTSYYDSFDTELYEHSEEPKV